MFQYIPRLNASLVLSLALFAGACSVKKDNTAAADSALNKDIQLANGDSAAQPALTDVPAATTPNTAPTTTSASKTTTSKTTTTTRTPTTTTRTPKTSVTSSGNTVTRTSGTAAGARTGTIPTGSTLNLASGKTVCTNTNHVGDRFTATVTNAISGSNGAVIPAGATANVEVTELKRSENSSDNVVMGFRVVSVTYHGHTYPISATTESADVTKVRNQPKSKDVQKVVGGAAIGAIAGRILGKSTKATVIGAAVGGAAGAGAAAATANYEGCVNSGARISAQLTAPAVVTI
ncbi:MAG: hypothetical protein ACREMS_01145 [Gemmatimonadaceae bacterium]